MKRLPIISFLMLVLGASTAMAQTANAGGTWNATLTSPQGTHDMQLILKQDGEKVNGMVKSERGEIPIEGTMTGKDLKLKYTIKFQDNDMVISLAGVVDGSAITGTANYGGMADGDFKAKRGGDTSATATKPVAGPAAATDITGTWAFQVESSQGAGTPTFTFKQESEKLTGQYKGAFGEAPVTGTVKENKVNFVIKIEAQGQQFTITYTGTVEKDGTMNGTAELGEAGSATWTAKRK